MCTQRRATGRPLRNRGSGEEEKVLKDQMGRAKRCGRGEERRKTGEGGERMKREKRGGACWRKQESYDYYAPCCFALLLFPIA